MAGGKEGRADAGKRCARPEGVRKRTRGIVTLREAAALVGLIACCLAVARLEWLWGM